MFKPARQFAADLLAEAGNDIAKTFILLANAPGAYPHVPQTYWNDVAVAIAHTMPKPYTIPLGAPIRATINVDEERRAFADEAGHMAELNVLVADLLEQGAVAEKADVEIGRYSAAGNVLMTFEDGSVYELVPMRVK